MGRRRGSIRNMNKDSKISIHVFVIWWTLFVLQAELVDSLHCSTYQSHVSIRPVCKSNLTQQSSASSGRLFKVLHTRDIIIQETLLLLLLLPASSYSHPSPPPILPILLLSSPPPPLALLPSSPPPPPLLLLDSFCSSHLQVSHTPDISLSVMWLHTSVAVVKYEEVKRLQMSD